MQPVSFLDQLAYDLRVVLACAVKDIRITLRSPLASVVIVALPINFLILELLFALSGGLAPTAVVMQDTGTYAQQFLDSMRNAHSFRLTPDQPISADEAQRQIEAANIVAVVTIPASFDDDLKAGRQNPLPVLFNNLNTEFPKGTRP